MINFVGIDELSLISLRREIRKATKRDSSLEFSFNSSKSSKINERKYDVSHKCSPEYFSQPKRITRKFECCSFEIKLLENLLITNSIQIKSILYCCDFDCCSFFINNDNKRAFLFSRCNNGY